jgi:hypothetical protein
MQDLPMQNTPIQNSEPLPVESTDPLIIALVVAGMVLLAVALFVWMKGRPFASGTVFRASRLSGGNRLFPTQVQITPSAVVHFTPQWIGRREHSIHIAHVSSVTIDTNLLFSDVLIETSGGTSSVTCHGHSKRDAIEMKRLIEHYQSLYYRQSPGASSATPPVALDPTSR